MANVGDQLLTPESGMQRIDDANLNFKYIGNWIVESNNSNYYNRTSHYIKNSETDVNNILVEFYVYTSNILILQSTRKDYSSNLLITIDEVQDNYSCNDSSVSEAIGNMVCYKKENMEKKIHHITIKSTDNIRWSFDAIDIDDDGYMCTEDEYLLQEGKAEFPVKVADDSVVTEADVLSYANTLVNGEKQLLVSEKLKKIYVTDGQGGMTELSSSSSGSGVEIDDTTPSFSKVYSSKYTQTLINAKIGTGNIIAGDNIEIETDSVNNTITIKSTATGDSSTGIISLPYFGDPTV